MELDFLSSDRENKAACVVSEPMETNDISDPSPVPLGGHPCPQVTGGISKPSETAPGAMLYEDCQQPQALSGITQTPPDQLEANAGAEQFPPYPSQPTEGMPVPLSTDTSSQPFLSLPPSLPQQQPLEPSRQPELHGLSSNPQHTPPEQPRFAPSISGSSSSETSKAEVLASSSLPGSLESKQQNLQGEEEAKDNETGVLLRRDSLGLKEMQSQGKDADREYSVLLIGKTGNGKSSLANTITGSRNFRQGRGMFVTTRVAQVENVIVRGRRLKVIDTADFTNVRTDENTAAKHIEQWKDLTDSSPDVIVLVVRCDVRYTKEEHAIYQEIVKLWGDTFLFRQRLLVAFTFGDRQDEDIVEELKTVNEELKSVMRDAHNRYVQVNNRARGEQEKEQLDAVCHVIDDVIEHGDDDVDMEIVMLPDTACLIVGKTGHGKSSVGNLLAGTPGIFDVRPGLVSVTKTATEHWTNHWASMCEKKLKVIDTPCLRSLSKEQKQQEVKGWKKMTEGLYVVILLVVRSDVRMTSDELSVYDDVKRLWGDHNYRLIVVFTFCDRLEYNLTKQVEDCPELKKVLQETGNAKILVNSDPKVSEEKKRAFVQDLLSFVNKSEMSGMAMNSSLTSMTTSVRSSIQSAGEGVKKFLGRTLKSFTD